MEHPRVYAITLSYNRKEDTIECIESLQKMTYPNYEILIVENGSTDDSLEAIRERFPEISIIEIKENVGYTRGFNTGIEYAYRNGADHFLILNNDIVIDPEALTELVKTAESDKEIGFVSGKVYYYNDPTKLQTVGKRSHQIYLAGEHVGFGEYDKGQYEETKEYDFVDDVFLLVRKEAYEKTGGYDENFFFHWEETDWCARVRRAGFRILYTPRAKIWHKGLLTTSDGIRVSDFFWVTRNQVPFMWRNGKLWQFAIFSFYLLFNRCPLTLARFLKHKNYKYIPPYIRGILSGYAWIFKRT